MVWLLLFSFGLTGLLSGMRHMNVYMARDYFHSAQFDAETRHFVELLTTLELNKSSVEELKQHIEVTDADIREHRYRYGDLEAQLSNIKAQYEGKIDGAKSAGDTSAADTLIAERDKKLADITNNFKSDEYVRQKVAAEKLQKLQQYDEETQAFKSQLAHYKKGYLYYFRDGDTGQVYTNIEGSDEEAKQVMNSSKNLFSRQYPERGAGSLFDGYMLQTGDWEAVQPIVKKSAKDLSGTVVIAGDADPASPVMAEYQRYKAMQMLLWTYAGLSVAALLACWYWNKRTGMFHSLLADSWQSHYRKIPLDVRIVLFLLSSFLTFVFVMEQGAFAVVEGYLYQTMMNIAEGTLTLAAAVAAVCIQWQLLQASRKSGTLRQEWEHALLYKGYDAVKQAFRIRSIGTQVTMLTALLFLAGSSALFAAVDPAFTIVYAVLCLFVALPAGILILKYAGYLNRIIMSTKELAAGQHVQDIPVQGASALTSLAKSINVLKQNVKASQREQAKSERLKTELITNVSHDLRTPLTSVITYTELLKTPGLGNEERAAYVEIIDRKSKRLKLLIDDLFEVSKMASGSMELAAERVDLVQLLQQALAEYDEAIAASTLQLRFSHGQPSIFVNVDGPKLWRVFDNLISNILKYSLENTRVYITAVQEGEEAVLTFKNVSKYELGGSTDELLERFRRGDTSRHTDGSGLGLAIAKSIVDLHGGSLEIEADGDLFKVVISLYGAE